ncbi:hypothetical protein CJU90_6750 [Yarrowia sp. C11]|nr:hypothetical protein CJU90_6750 [Yarrowia sp. C11]KAG5359414.1 hypothetical protein CKK34_5765 [Yarrowia sp. E02]
MVSAKSMILAAALATAAVAAPAPAPNAAPAPVVLNERANEELAARTVEIYAAQALQERGLLDLVGSLTSVVGVVINLLVGSVNSIVTPGSPSAAEVLAKTFTDLTTGLNSVVAALEALPGLGPVIGLLVPIILSPLVLNLTTTLEKILVLLVDDVDKALLGPVLNVLPPLLAKIDQVLNTLLGGVPALSGQLNPALELVDKIKGVLGGLGVSL